MNWQRIGVNVIGAAAFCLGAHGAAGAGVSVLSSGAAWFGVGLCVASNLAGLFQPSPSEKKT